ncbi:dimethylarginine dimethylaminohydrolase family protein [Bacillus sp. P14.5]|uniref:dimethylarginine dimethylaminohydrolase family protein n=1 Tax=Bacillus sp. P14.5 TaxID=1983400 RepID=UPI000DEA5E78|nr:dimethylarginine dimethylaminohydrolase family protein [Bacillus sp. P14.5]
MATTIRKNQTEYCDSEYDRLEKVIVCQPRYMKIDEVINETQKHFLDKNIDIKTALKQHNDFVKALKDNGTEVINMTPDPQLPEQVFTRDIGFTIGDTIYVSEMGSDIRAGEDQVLQKWLEEHGHKYEKLDFGSIEGGDVIVDKDKVFVGVSHRTNMGAIDQLREMAEGFTIIPVPFQKKYLHLDCVFNILSPDQALVFTPAFKSKELQMLAEHFNLIEVNDEEQFTMGTNVLSIGNKKVLSLPQNQDVNRALKQHGYEVVEVDFSEIIKSGGSFRCCSMPVLRK